jgi:methyl-accepting chemotaxis protein
MNLKLNSVRTMMFAGGLAVAVLPAAIMGIGSIYEVTRLVRNESTDGAQKFAVGLAKQFNDFLVAHRSASEFIADELAVTDRAEPAAAGQVLARGRARFGILDRISLLNEQGVVVATDPPVAGDGRSPVGLNLADRDYFRRVMATRKSYVEREIVLARTTLAPTLIIAAPVLNAAGNAVGAVVSSYNGSDIAATTNGMQLGATGHAYVTTETGLIVAHPNQKLVEERRDFSKLPIWKFIGASPTGRVDEYVDETGTPRAGGFATVGETGWKVVFSRTLGEINGQALSGYFSLLVWVLIAVVLAGLGVAYLARRVAAPIDTLRTMAGDVAGGNLDRRAPETGPDELASLARAINVMAESAQRGLRAEKDAKQKLEQAVQDYGVLSARVAAGDLSVRATAEGDDDFARLGKGLNNMTASLGSLVSEIRSAAGAVESAAAEILAATSQQVAATTEEAAAVRQTAATVAEVRQTAEAAARKVRSVTELVQRMETTANDGRQSVDESVRGSEEGRLRMEALAERILAFSDQAQQIAEINATVSDLAEQSNLLAVNASIEAAKAGESGRGFAVVAAEVKELAERSRDATAQVRRIVTEIQKSAQGAVMAAEQGVKMAEAGSIAARRSGDAIGKLADSVSQAAQAAQQVTASSQQQEAGMEQMVLSMHNIEQSSAQTVAATQQVERAAKDMSKLAQRLTEIVRAMKIAEPLRA